MNQPRLFHPTADRARTVNIWRCEYRSPVTGRHEGFTHHLQHLDAHARAKDADNVIGVEIIRVPTSKTDLCAWLNEHASHPTPTRTTT